MGGGGICLNPILFYTLPASVVGGCHGVKGVKPVKENGYPLHVLTPLNTPTGGEGTGHGNYTTGIRNTGHTVEEDGGVSGGIFCQHRIAVCWG